MSYALRDILLVSMLFSDGTDANRRPVMVVYHGGDDGLLVAPVTSHPARTRFDVRLNEWPKAGLRLPSIVRLEKLATVEKSTIVRKLGQVSPEDWENVQPKLKDLFAAILSED